MTEQIIFLTNPEEKDANEARFRFKLPPLSMSRNTNVSLELLQAQIEFNNFNVGNQTGLDLRLNTASNNYIGTDSNGVSLGLITYNTYTQNTTKFYYKEPSTYKVSLFGNPDYLDFGLYDVNSDIIPVGVQYIKIILKVTYNPVGKPSEDYRQAIPLPSRLL